MLLAFSKFISKLRGISCLGEPISYDQVPQHSLTVLFVFIEFYFDLVLVESLAALLPHPACIHHLPQQYGRSVLAISSLLV